MKKKRFFIVFLIILLMLILLITYSYIDRKDKKESLQNKDIYSEKIDIANSNTVNTKEKDDELLTKEIEPKDTTEVTEKTKEITNEITTDKESIVTSYLDENEQNNKGDSTVRESKNEDTTQNIVEQEKNDIESDLNSQTNEIINDNNQIVQENKQEETKKEEDKKNETQEETKIVEKSIYDYEFNIEKIKAELISIGEGMGLTHITEDGGTLKTPNNSSWSDPVRATKDFQGEKLKRALKDYVSSMPILIEAYGGGQINTFTIYVENNGNGNYTFYFLY